MNFYMFENNTFGLKKDGGVLKTGSLKEIAVLAVSCNVSLDDLTETMVMMNHLGHTRANFGYNGTFIFSSEK
jgi:hypothetical protein